MVAAVERCIPESKYCPPSWYAGVGVVWHSDCSLLVQGRGLCCQTARQLLLHSHALVPVFFLLPFKSWYTADDYKSVEDPKLSLVRAGAGRWQSLHAQYPVVKRQQGCWWSGWHGRVACRSCCARLPTWREPLILLYIDDSRKSHCYDSVKFFLAEKILASQMPEKCARYFASL